MKNIKTQLIYTYPERKLYGEFCLLSLLELRIKIVKGEIKEKLCFIDSKDKAHIYDEFAIPDDFSDEDLEVLHSHLLREFLTEQMKLRK